MSASTCFAFLRVQPFLIFFEAHMVAPLIPHLAAALSVSQERIGFIVPAYIIPETEGPDSVQFWVLAFAARRTCENVVSDREDHGRRGAARRAPPPRSRRWRRGKS